MFEKLLINKGMFSSDKQDWETPQYFVSLVERYIDKKFDLDCCSYPETAKAPKYYTISDNAFTKDWKGTVWMNPPYGKSIPMWLEYAYYQSIKHQNTIVCLISVRTDTKWFHEWAVKGHIVFLKGRIKFLRDGREHSTAAFPSMLIIFNNDKIKTFSCWAWKEGGV